MLPDPLHPAIVHFPIALAVAMPFIALAVLVAIGRGSARGRTWAIVVVLQALLLGVGWLAMETGEHEEDRVEKVVAEERIDVHHEAAERFLYVAGGALALSVLGLFGGGLGRAARAGTVLAGAVAIWAVVVVGHSGGELVYKYGAADAYRVRP